MATIYTGTWVNWQAGLLYGARFTTTSPQALCLVSFLAIFIVVVGRHFWGILRFTLHQLRVVRGPQDGLYYQQQALLRNSASPTAALYNFMRIGWAWRGRAEYSLARVTPLILLSLATTTVFTIAGVFSSGTFSVTNEVLIKSDACGYLNYPEVREDAVYNTSDWNLLSAAFVEDREASTKSMAYAKTCYTDNAGPDCNYFAVPRLQSVNASSACPFDDSMCIGNNGTGALMMDSGYIYTDKDLGINSKQHDSLAYRRVTTCAPIKNVEYSQWVKNAAGDDQYLEFYYGDYINAETGERLPVTFAHDALYANYTSVAYPVNYQMSAMNDSSISTFDPIDTLKRTDGDVTLVFLFNNARYTAPVNDLWFNATIPSIDVYGLGQYTYGAPLPIAVMGCVEQHQFCMPNEPASTGCSELTGFSAVNTTSNATYSAAQRSVAKVLKHAISSTLISDMIFQLGPAALSASSSVFGTSTLLSAPLPDNQWAVEIANWHDYTMAHLQRLVVNVAAGPAVASSNTYIVPPARADSDAFDICANQKVIDSRHYTFSVPGLTIIVVFGILIMITNLLLPTIIGILQRLIGHGLHRKEDWDHDHVLQLQRLAYEGNKLGTWSSREGGVPTTLQSMESQRFMRPGRVVKAYEPLELAERGGGIPNMTTPTIASPARAATSMTKGGFVGIPNVEVTGDDDYDDDAKSAYYNDNDDPFHDDKADMGLGIRDNRSFDMGVSPINARGGYTARPSVEVEYYSDRPESGSSSATKSREFV